MLFRTSRTAISVAGTNGPLRCLDETTTIGWSKLSTALVTGLASGYVRARHVRDCIRERWIRWQATKKRRKMYAW